MFIQIGSITNIFTGPVNAGRQNPLVALVIGGVTIAVSISLVPLVLALTGALLALASVLLGAAALVGATGLTIGLPYAARQFRIGAQAQRDTVIAHGIQMGVAEHIQMRSRMAPELPSPPIYVASSTGIEIESGVRR